MALPERELQRRGHRVIENTQALSSLRELVRRTREHANKDLAFPREIAIPPSTWEGRNWQKYTLRDVEDRLRDNIHVVVKGRYSGKVRDGFGKLLKREEYRIHQIPVIEEGNRTKKQVVILTDSYAKDRAQLVWAKLNQEVDKVDEKTGKVETRNGLGWINFKTEEQKADFVKKLNEAKLRKKLGLKKENRFDFKKHVQILGWAALLAISVFAYANWPTNKSPQAIISEPKPAVTANAHQENVSQIEPTLVPTVAVTPIQASVEVREPAKVIYSAPTISASTATAAPIPTERPAFIELNKDQAEKVVGKIYAEPIKIKPNQTFDQAIRERLPELGTNQQNQLIQKIKDSSGLSLALIIDPQLARQSNGDLAKINQILDQPIKREVNPIKLREEIKGDLTDAILRR